MSQTHKVLEVAENCTLFNDLKLESENICIKTLFFNAVLGRIEQNYKQEDVASYLNISKRTVVELEKGRVDKLTLVFKYINLFGYDFANNKKELKKIKLRNRLKRI